jgi:hypothetical protein
MFDCGTPANRVPVEQVDARAPESEPDEEPDDAPDDDDPEDDGKPDDEPDGEPEDEPDGKPEDDPTDPSSEGSEAGGLELDEQPVITHAIASAHGRIDAIFMSVTIG